MSLQPHTCELKDTCPKSEMALLFVPFVSLLAVLWSHCIILTNSCHLSDSVCEFLLVVDERLTMMHGSDLVFPSNGKLYRYDVTNTSLATPISPDDVITGDGFSEPRLVVVANGTMPGPTIHVYEGQNVVIHVENRLLSDGVTIHIHGQPQLGTPWMDGVAFVTQCPILPGQCFTYKFKATPKGTYWWHSHIGSQRTMGLFGGFIVYERNDVTSAKRYEEQEFVLSLQDWNAKREADFGYQQMKTNIFVDNQKYKVSSSLDGARFGKFYMTSALINGRGRLHDPKSGTHNSAPLETFTVTQGYKYRFRVIGAGEMYSFRVSIDNHILEIIASDGYEIEPVVVESFIIYPGERYDFILTANNTVANYWIRAKSLEVEYDHVAEAILRYMGSDETAEPKTQRANCTYSERCRVLNCPFVFYPKEAYTDCVSIDQLHSRDQELSTVASPDQFKEFFLNFAMPHTKASVNGRAFRFPTVSALTQPQEIDTACDIADCEEDSICRCTNSISFEKGDMVQLVFMNMGIGTGILHPIHSHGHSFYVMKIGFGGYNKTTGKLISQNEDIDCRGDPDVTICSKATWSDPSWLGGNIPDMVTQFPVRKDTVAVPPGGYVVVRIVADNPGLWIVHCHIEMHTLDGMALLLNESFCDVPLPPPGFPTCRNFKPLDDCNPDDNSLDNTLSSSRPDQTGMYSPQAFWGTICFLLSLLLVQLVIIITIRYQPCMKIKQLQGYEIVRDE